jgi:TIR domain
MKNTLAIDTDPAFIRPLGEAQNEFLQVLLTEFNLRHSGQGLVLEVEFDFDSPALWLRQGKGYTQRQIDSASAVRYQQKLEGILLGHDSEDWTHNDPAFPFRFGNGGTLPVIRRGERDFYCLFYRDIAPVGWNIANGGAESAAELLDPLETIERELREELVIVEPKAGHRYVFDWDEGRRADHPEFRIARRFWQEIFQQRNYLELRERVLPLKWLPGRDSVIIRFNDEAPIEISDCILNINAEDFGIEVDRVAKLNIGPETVLCDGETARGQLVNQVVGLFDVHRFNAAMAAGRTEFFPDHVFWSGSERPKEDVRKAIQDYLDDVYAREIRASDMRATYEETPCKFGLCPVTRNVVRRFLLLEQEETADTVVSIGSAPARSRTTTTGKPDVFLSFASEASTLAHEIYSFLRKSGQNVFFSEETLHQSNFGDAIDNALKEAGSLVVVGTEIDHFNKPWVRYEWRSFHNDILNLRKAEETPVVTVTTRFDKHVKDALPRPLLNYTVIACDPSSPGSSLDQLRDLLRQPQH